AHLYQAAFAILKAIPDPRKEDWWDDIPKVPPEVKAALPAFGEPLDLAQRAGLLPVCRLKLRYEDGFSMALPHLYQFRKLRYLLKARAAVRAEGGDLGGAEDDLRALFAMTRALRQEPILVSQVLRFRLAKKGFLALESV